MLLHYCFPDYFFGIGDSSHPCRHNGYQDYDVKPDIVADVETEIIFAYRQGAGLDQHPSTNRGSISVSLASGDSTVVRAMLCRVGVDDQLLAFCGHKLCVFVRILLYTAVDARSEYCCSGSS